MHALLPHAAGRCLAQSQLRSQRSSSSSRSIIQSASNEGSVRAPRVKSLCSSSNSSSRLRSSSQSQADVADQYPELEPFSAVDSTVEALLTAELEAEGEEPPEELEALVAAAAAASSARQQQAADSQDENPYSPEDALR